MSVFRRRIVFREPEVFRFGGLSIVTATVTAAAIVFAGTAAGSTPSVTGDASGGIVFSGGPVSTISIEVSGSGNVVLAGAATGLQRNLGSASGGIALAGSARCDAIGSGSIVFGGSATVGSIFTMDAAGAIVFAGSVAGANGSTALGSVIFAGTLGAPNITGGTITTSAAGSLILAGTAVGSITAAANVPDLFFFAAKFSVELSTLTESDPVTITGNTQPAIISITNGTYSINGSAFTSIAGVINAGDEVVIRHTSAATYETQQVSPVIIGGLTGSFVSVTIRGPDRRTPIGHRLAHKPRRRVI